MLVGAYCWDGTRRCVLRRIMLQFDLMLSLESQLTEVAGTGCIVRVMTDRRTV